MMKRCFFACLFAGILCLVNVANADYQWSESSPAGVSAGAWTTINFTITPTLEGTSISAGVFEETGLVSISDKNPTLPTINDYKYFTTIDLAGLLLEKDAAYYYLKIDSNTLAGGYDGWSDYYYLLGVDAGIGDYRTFLESEPNKTWYLTDGGNGIDSLNSVINVYYYGEVGYLPEGSFSFEIAAADAPTTTVPSPTPEPATLAIFGLGLAGLGLCRRLRK